MLRHLQNANELVLYASLSCGAAFLGRILPPFYFPILLLRLGIFSYCAFVIFRAEGQRELALVIGASLFLGMLGGYWDLIEIHLRYNLAQVVTVLTSVVLFIVTGLVVFYQLRKA